MRPTQDEMTQNLAERLWWEVARRDDSRVARRLYRQPLVDGVYRRDEGALLDDFFHFLQAIGVMALLEQGHGAAIQREMLPFVQYVLLYGLKPLFGVESMNALPSLLFSDEALMRLVGFAAQHVRQGICQRGATKRQGERTPGPIWPATPACRKWSLIKAFGMAPICGGWTTTGSPLSCRPKRPWRWTADARAQAAAGCIQSALGKAKGH